MTELADDMSDWMEVRIALRDEVIPAEIWHNVFVSRRRVADNRIVKHLLHQQLRSEERGFHAQQIQSYTSRATDKYRS